MGVSASRFDIHSTTDSRDVCWVAHHLCTHDRAPPLTEPHSIPHGLSRKLGSKSRFVLCVQYVAAAVPIKARQHFLSCFLFKMLYKYILLLQLIGLSCSQYCFQVVSSPLSPPWTHLQSRAAAGGLPGLVPSHKLLLADLKLGNRLCCADQDQGNHLAVSACPFLIFILWSVVGKVCVLCSSVYMCVKLYMCVCSNTLYTVCYIFVWLCIHMLSVYGYTNVCL